MKSSESEIVARLNEIRASYFEERGTSRDPNDQEHDDLRFLFLEKELLGRTLTSLSQLPIRGTEVIPFVNSIPADPVVFTVMQKIKMTECLQFPLTQQNLLDRDNKVTSSRTKILYSPYLSGTGFDCIFDRSNGRENVMVSGEIIYPSVIGFALPSQMICHRIGKMFNTFKLFRSIDSYTAHRLKELKLPPGSAFKGHPKEGFNICHTKSYADIAFTFVREYRLFSLTLKPTAELNPNFLEKVKGLSSYSVEEFFGLKQWEELFSTHGTHVVKSANGGGKVVITILENSLKNYFKTEDLFKKEKQIEEVLTDYLDRPDGENKNVSFDNLAITSVKLFGGDPKFEQSDLKKCKDSSEMKNLLQEWINSLPFRPVMLDSSISIESIPDILDRKEFSEEALLLDNVAKKLWGKSFRKTESSRQALESQKLRWGFW